MNLAINSAAIVAAPTIAVADPATNADNELLGLHGKIFELYEKAHEHDDDLGRLQDVWFGEYQRLVSSGSNERLAWVQVKQMPESAEHSRLAKLTAPFHEEIGRLITRMMSVPAQTEAAKAAKAEVLINCVMGSEWLETDADANWEVRMARNLLLEFVGNEFGEQLKRRFA
jgi:hypothetical protein